MVSGLPEIPLEFAVLAVVSAGLLLWAAYCIVGSLTVGDVTEPDSAPFSRASYDIDSGIHYRGQLSFVAALFCHIFLFALIPWLELVYYSPLVYDIQRYDLVILQFRLPDGPLRIPADLQKLMREREEPTPPKLDDYEFMRVRAVDRPELESPEGLPVRARSTPEPSPEGAPVKAKAEPKLAIPPDVKIATENRIPERKALNELADPGPQVIDLRDKSGPGTAENTYVFLAEMGVGELDAPGEAPETELPMEGRTVERAQLDLSPGDRGPGNEGAGSRRALSELTDAPGMELAGGELSGGYDFDGDDQVLGTILGKLGLPKSWGETPNGPPGVPGTLSDGAPVKPGIPDGRGHRLTPVPRKAHGIILISDTPTGIPEAVGVLTGNPVYTVYVDVPNSSKKWILQFCAQTELSKGAIHYAEGVIRIVRKERIDPPFALYKAPIELPSDFSPDPFGPRRIVVYGTVDKAGGLHDLKIVRGADPKTDETVLANLQRWEFLPAFRGDQPVAVEAVFGIPIL